MVIRENILTRFTEHVAIGISAGYSVIAALTFLESTTFSPLMKGEWYYIIPIILGIVLYSTISSEYRYLSRYPLAIMVGSMIALGVTAGVSAQIIDQIVATALPLTGSPMEIISNLVIIITTLTVLYNFIFIAQKGTISDNIFRIGRISIMVAFGATFGNYILTVLTRLVDTVFRVLGV
jgi:hypothetical protein